MFEDNPNVNECCKKEENLVVIEIREGNLIVRRCTVCLRKHYELIADPGRIGMELKSIG